MVVGTGFGTGGSAAWDDDGAAAFGGTDGDRGAVAAAGEGAGGVGEALVGTGDLTGASGAAGGEADVDEEFVAAGGTGA